MATRASNSQVLKQFTALNQEVTMENAIQGKLQEEHDKRVQENDEKNEVYNNLVSEKTVDQEENSDEDLDGDDAELMRRMAEQRIGDMYREDAVEKKKQKGSVGEYREVDEEEFFNVVTKNKYTVCHFHHNDFNRCKIAEMHLRKIAYEHPESKFIQIDVQKSPFLVEKLLVVVLPTIAMFKDGVKIDEINGFDDFGGRDEFETFAMTRRLARSKVIELKEAEKFKLERKVKEKVAGDSDTDSEED